MHQGEFSEPAGHLDNDTIDRMLQGPRPAAERTALMALLHAAAAGPRPHELAGEEHAVIAFRATVASPARARWWRRLLTLKIFAVTATITVGGLAFASSTGVLPSPFFADPAPAPAPPPSVSQTSPPPASSADPAPTAQSWHGHCTAIMAKSPEQRQKALSTPAFADLVAEAGSADQVSSFCRQLIAAVDKAEKTAEPKPSKPPKALRDRPAAPGTTTPTSTGRKGS